MNLTPTSEPISKDGASEDRGKASAKEAGTTHPTTMATIADDDERLLARIGYKQVHITNY